MISIGQLCGLHGQPVPGMRRALNDATEWWMYVAIPTLKRPVPGMPGIYKLALSADEISRAFFRELIRQGGTEADIEQMIQMGAMSREDISTWHDVLVEQFEMHELTPEDFA